MAARRSAIMTGAREMLTEKNLADISLRELSHRVGLAKSNELRYFDSREAILLDVLDEEFQAWLTGLDARLGKPRARKPGYATEVRVATTISLVEAELLCELLASMAVVLERNISGEFARDFKARATANTATVGQLVARHLPWLPREFTEFFGEVPTEPVRATMAEMGFPDPRERFRDGLRGGLATWLIGAAAQTEA
jgi:AcrR family transcriptional regulator